MLVLPAYVRDALVEHAREGAPEEVCGVLAGQREGDQGSEGDRGGEDDEGEDEQIHVQSARRVPNVADHPRTEYRLDPEAQLRAIEELEAEGREVVGFYHSHPAGPDRPSPTDEARATWPGYVYVIVSLGDGDVPAVGAWRWTGEAFEDVEIRVDEFGSE